MRVAIVDDDESVCRSLLRLLRSAGMKPTAFLSAEEYLASPLRAAFRCVVSDVLFRSGTPGLQLRQRMLDEGDPTPVVFFTAHDDVETQIAAQRLGCAAFVPKDEPMLLLEALREIERGAS